MNFGFKLVLTWDISKATLARMVDAHPTPCQGGHLTRGTRTRRRRDKDGRVPAHGTRRFYRSPLVQALFVELVVA